MPQLVAEAVIYVVEVWGVSAATAVAVANVIVTAVYYAAASALLNAASKALSPSNPTGSGRNLEVSVTDATAPARIILGFVKAGGVNVIPPFNSGANGENLHQVLALAGHECDSFGDVYFNQDNIPTASITGVTGVSNDGLVTSGTYANRAYVRRYSGTATQTADYRLTQAFPTAFSSTFRGRGITYAAVDLVFDQDGYSSGFPQITFEVHGAKCYDPRLDVSPGANPTTLAYIAWTQNPALQLAWYLMSDLGGGYSAAEIDWALVVAAANICDGSLSGATAPPSGTQARFTCNLMMEATNDIMTNIKAITDTMLGRVIFRDGLWRIYAGAWASPVHAIDQTAFVGPVTIQCSSERDQRYNGVRVFFVNPAKNWQRVECYPRANATYMTNDGSERIWKEVEIPGCTDEYQAQRLGEFLLRQSRNQITISGDVGPRWMKLALWETVAMTWTDMGWSGKTFRVISYTVNPNGKVSVGLQEEQSGDWTDLATAEYNNPSISTMPTVNPTTPSAPQNFSVEALHGTLRFDWDPPDVFPDGSIYQLWTAPGSTQSSLVSSGTLMWTGLADFTELPAAVYSDASWWVRAIVPNSTLGPFTPSGSGLYGRAWLAPEHQFSNRAFPNGEFLYPTVSASYWRNISGASIAWSYDTTHGLSTGQGCLTLTASGPLYTNAIDQLYPRKTAEIDLPRVAPRQKGTLAYAFQRVNSGNASLRLQFQVTGRVWTPGTKDYLSFPTLSIVSTMHNVGSYSVGQWVYGSLAFTMPDSPCTHVQATINQPDSPTSGTLRVGMMQIYFQ